MLCSGCGRIFPRLDDTTCYKCRKIEAANNDIDRNIAASSKQCMTCSIVFPLLSGNTCGQCAQDQTTETVQVVMDRAKLHTEESATFHRLGEGSRPGTVASKAIPKAVNPNLQKANAAKVHAKELNVARNRHKAELVQLKAKLVLVPEDGTGKPIKPDGLDYIHEASTSDAIDLVLNTFVKKIHNLFEASKAGRRYQNWGLDWEDTEWAVVVPKAKVPMEEKWLRNDFATLFANQSIASRMAEKDRAKRELALELKVTSGAGDIEDDDEYVSVARSSKKSRTRSTKRSASVSIQPKHGPGPSKHRVSAVSQASSSGHTYKSAFRPSASPLTYESFPIKSVTVGAIDPACGRAVLATSQPDADSRFLLVGKGWNTEGNRAALLGEGACKVVIRGLSSKKEPIAIAQNKLGQSDEAQNLEDLKSELLTMHQLDYFLGTFYERMNGVNDEFENIDISWNIQHTFLATLEAAAFSEHLHFESVLISSIIDSTGGRFQKFSGTEDFEENNTPVGRLMEAFTHHVVEDSQRSILPADLQGFVFPLPNNGWKVVLIDAQMHTEQGDSGFADKGAPIIQKWIAEHHCNAWCKSFGLANLKSDKERRRQAMDISDIIN